MGAQDGRGELGLLLQLPSYSTSGLRPRNLLVASPGVPAVLVSVSDVLGRFCALPADRGGPASSSSSSEITTMLLALGCTLLGFTLPRARFSSRLLESVVCWSSALVACTGVVVMVPTVRLCAGCLAVVTTVRLGVGCLVVMTVFSGVEPLLDGVLGRWETLQL